MSIVLAQTADTDTVMNITHKTINEIYPHYYPRGAVNFFLGHHSRENIQNDIMDQRVFLCYAKKTAVGTVTINNSEIDRLFVLPEYQGLGYGKELLEYAEKIIMNDYSEIRLAASLSAKSMYLKRGYIEKEYHVLHLADDDFLCYDIMVRSV